MIPRNTWDPGDSASHNNQMQLTAPARM